MKIKLPACKKNSHSGRLHSLVIMNLLALMLFIPVSAYSQTWYIKPSSEIPLRRGQGTDYKILAVLPDGTAVTLIEENDPWAKVSTPEGTEGWVLKRYLTQDMPLHDLVETLQQKNDTLKEELSDLQQKNEELARQQKTLEEELDKNNKELAETKKNYTSLREDTANVISIKEELIQTQETNESLQQELKKVSTSYEQLKSGQNVQWFLAGGGTLIFGCIVGMLFSRSKKRRSSLY